MQKEEEAARTLASALRGPLRSRELLVWTAAAFVCSLLDETLIAFGTLRLQERLGASLAMRNLAFAAFAAGGAVGTALTAMLLLALEPVGVLAAASVSRDR